MDSTEETDLSFNELANDIIASIEDNGLYLSKCRVQRYNSATNIGSIYTGIYSRIAAK